MCLWLWRSLSALFSRRRRRRWALTLPGRHDTQLFTQREWHMMLHLEVLLALECPSQSLTKQLLSRL